MFRKIAFGTALAALLTFATPGAVFAWGAAHVGYTHVGPNGAYHAGATEVGGARGGYSTAHVGAVGAGGSTYHATSAYGAYHPPGAAPYAGGYRADSYHAVDYKAGVYRAP